MAYRKKYDPVLEDSIKKILYGAVKTFRSKYYGEIDVYRNKMEFLRAVYDPKERSPYFKSADFEYENFDASPINSLERATAGFMSFLISPVTEFFTLTRPKRMAGEYTDLDKLELANNLVTRGKELHEVLQMPENQDVYASNYFDKCVYNICGKVIEEDANLVGRFTYIPPEDLMEMSTDGVKANVFGVREMLNLFQAERRFGPRPSFVGTKDLLSSDYKYYYRINILRRDLYAQFMSVIEEDAEPVYADYIRNYLDIGKRYKPEKDLQWCDLWFNDEEILSVEIKNYRNIVISHFSPSKTAVCGLGKSLGEKAAPTHCLLTELESINLTGYERTYDPFYAVHSESDAVGADLGRGAILTYDEPRAIPQNGSLGADIRGMIEYKQFVQARFDRMVFLDVFELINKSRMPTAEINIRSDASKRTVVAYVIRDTMDDLNPTVRALNFIGEKNAVFSNKGLDYLLNASFTSPLSQVHKDSKINDTLKVIQVLGELNKLDAEGQEVTDFIDASKKGLGLLKDLGDTEWFRSKQEAQERAESRVQQMDAERRAKEAEGLAQTANALRAGGEGQQATPAPGGVPGEQAQAV